MFNNSLVDKNKNDVIEICEVLTVILMETEVTPYRPAYSYRR